MATVNEQMTKLLEANLEAKETLRQVHEARASAKEIVKKQKKDISLMIEAEVIKQIRVLKEEIREKMIFEVKRIIQEFEKDWREKLGLDKEQ